MSLVLSSYLPPTDAFNSTMSFRRSSTTIAPRSHLAKRRVPSTAPRCVRDQTTDPTLSMALRRLTKEACLATHGSSNGSTKSSNGLSVSSTSTMAITCRTFSQRSHRSAHHPPPLDAIAAAVVISGSCCVMKTDHRSSAAKSRPPGDVSFAPVTTGYIHGTIGGCRTER